jgi:hypothetical protein
MPGILQTCLTAVQASHLHHPVRLVDIWFRQALGCIPASTVGQISCSCLLWSSYTSFRACSWLGRSLKFFRNREDAVSCLLHSTRRTQLRPRLESRAISSPVPISCFSFQAWEYMQQLPRSKTRRRSKKADMVSVRRTECVVHRATCCSTGLRMRACRVGI